MLKVSRPELETTKLVQYSDPFLQLPIEGYLSLLGITPNTPQTALINAVNNPAYRFITACLSRRVGKTFIANVIGQMVALWPGTTILIIAPDYSLATISWDLQRELLDKFSVERIRDNAKDRVIELTNGSMIRIASVSRADSAVGRSYDLIIFDEAALNDYGGTVFNINLRPTLDKDRSKCIFISTPRGDNWFREFFERGFSSEPLHSDWVSIHADWHENPRASEKDIMAAKATMSSAEFEQEYLGNFVTFEGQIWQISDSQIQDLTHYKNSILDGSRRADIIAGLDLGFRDHTALCVLAVEETDAGLNKYYLIDEYFARGRSTAQHAAEINALQEKWNIDFIFIDSSAAQTRHDLAATYDIATINAKKSVVDGIGAVAAVIENERFVVEEMCFESVYAIRNYKWKVNSGGQYSTEAEKPEHNRASHMADAIRYAIYSFESGSGGVM